VPQWTMCGALLTGLRSLGALAFCAEAWSRSWAAEKLGYLVRQDRRRELITEVLELIQGKEPS
jgi:hypothetical protein